MWEAQNELASPSAESPKTSLLIAPRDDCGIEKPIRPAEFGLFVLLLAFGVFIMMAVALAILYAKSVPYGKFANMGHLFLFFSIPPNLLFISSEDPPLLFLD